MAFPPCRYEDEGRVVQSDRGRGIMTGDIRMLWYDEGRMVSCEDGGVDKYDFGRLVGWSSTKSVTSKLLCLKS